MEKRETKQSFGRMKVGISIEVPAEVGEVEIDREGIQRKPPGGEVAEGCGCTYWYHRQAVAESHSPTQAGVGDRHHLVASTRVVPSVTPAQRVEMRKLPGVQYPT